MCKFLLTNKILSSQITEITKTVAPS